MTALVSGVVCDAITCGAMAQPEHSPCCSSTFHGKLCCTRYCRSHFVEVAQCSPESHATASPKAKA